MGDSFWVVRDLPSGTERFASPTYRSRIGPTRMSPDGRYLVIGGDQGHVSVWEIETGELRFRWQPFGGKPAGYLAFTPEGDLMAVADEVGPLTVLRMAHLRRQLASVGLDW